MCTRCPGWPRSMRARATARRQLNYLLTDALGSTGTVLDGTGKQVNTFFYDPFGVRTNADSSAFTSPVGQVTDGFTGQEHDDDWGLINFKGRIYDPHLKRMLSTDPHVTFPLAGQNWNPYSYVMNNPVNFIDPSGLDVCDWCNPAPPCESGDCSPASPPPATSAVPSGPSAPTWTVGTPVTGGAPSPFEPLALVPPTTPDDYGTSIPQSGNDQGGGSIYNDGSVGPTVANMVYPISGQSMYDCDNAGYNCVAHGEAKFPIGNADDLVNRVIPELGTLNTITQHIDQGELGPEPSSPSWAHWVRIHPTSFREWELPPYPGPRGGLQWN